MEAAALDMRTEDDSRHNQITGAMDGTLIEVEGADIQGHKLR